jgi:hypothetical protein
LPSRRRDPRPPDSGSRSRPPTRGRWTM